MQVVELTAVCFAALRHCLRVVHLVSLIAQDKPAPSRDVRLAETLRNATSGKQHALGQCVGLRHYIKLHARLHAANKAALTGGWA